MSKKQLNMVMIPARTVTPEISKYMIKLQFIYSMFGLGIGLLCILGGVLLFMNGVFGAANWTVQIFGVQSKLVNASPGAILFVVGIYITFITRFSAKVKKMFK